MRRRLLYDIPMIPGRFRPRFERRPYCGKLALLDRRSSESRQNLRPLFSSDRALLQPFQDFGGLCSKGEIGGVFAP
jgi:hypothetical protein